MHQNCCYYCQWRMDTTPPPNVHCPMPAETQACVSIYYCCMLAPLCYCGAYSSCYYFSVPQQRCIPTKLPLSLRLRLNITCLPQVYSRCYIILCAKSVPIVCRTPLKRHSIRWTSLIFVIRLVEAFCTIEVNPTRRGSSLRELHTAHPKTDSSSNSNCIPKNNSVVQACENVIFRNKINIPTNLG